MLSVYLRRGFISWFTGGVWGNTGHWAGPGLYLWLWPWPEELLCCLALPVTALIWLGMVWRPAPGKARVDQVWFGGWWQRQRRSRCIRRSLQRYSTHTDTLGGTHHRRHHTQTVGISWPLSLGSFSFHAINNVEVRVQGGMCCGHRRRTAEEGWGRDTWYGTSMHSDSHQVSICQQQST